jgi:hypothetical protein
MRASVFVLALVSACAISAVGCAAGPDDASEAGASELRATKFTRLDLASQDQVLDTLSTTFNADLATCLAAHPEIDVVTKDNALRLTQIANVSYMDLHEAIEGILESNKLDSASSSKLKSLVRAWGKAQLAPHTADGIVTYDTVDSLAIYSAVRSTEEKLSIERAANPTGANIGKLREQWRKVEGLRNLDSAFLRPVKVDHEPAIGEIKRHFKFPFPTELVSGAWQAVDDMAAADEGPNGAAEFTPIANTLKHASGITKRWYFTGGGEDWSTNILVVLDDKNQLWGFSMGYSE